MRKKNGVEVIDADNVFSTSSKKTNLMQVAVINPVLYRN